MESNNDTYSVFEGFIRIGGGSLKEAAEFVKNTRYGQTGASVLMFNDRTGEQSDTGEIVIKSPQRGRPRLGVVAREVTLLPRHWEWLSSQPGGASVALRRLVDEARKNPADERKLARDVIYRFMSSMCGNLPGYEEAVRALYSKDGGEFFGMIAKWPGDIVAYIKKLGADTFHD